MAAASNSQRAISILVDAHADQEALNNAANNPLALAVENLHREAILILCERGANVNASSKEGLGTPLVVAIRNHHL